MENRLENFIPFPRHIAKDKLEGIITHNEWLVYTWLRQNIDPYGYVSATLDSIAHDVFTKPPSNNYINKILLELKRKRYLYYPKRTGRRGSYNIQFDEIKYPKGQVKIFGKDENSSVRGVKKYPTPNESEVDTYNGSDSQTFYKQKDISNTIKTISDRMNVRGYNTETNTKNKTNTSELIDKNNQVEFIEKNGKIEARITNYKPKK